MITRKTSYAIDGRTKLLEQFKNVLELLAIVDAASEQTQDSEDVGWQLLVDRWLESSDGVQLDGIGEIVGEGRLGRDDETYRIFLRARILLNLSSGTGDEVIAIMALVCGVPVSLEEPGTATILVSTQNGIASGVNAYAARILRKAKVGGVKAFLTYFEVPIADAFTFADGDVEQASVERGFADDGQTIGGSWADAMEA